MGAIITLTADFGLADGRVALAKGIALGMSPPVSLIDISHKVKAPDVARAHPPLADPAR